MLVSCRSAGKDLGLTGLVKYVSVIPFWGHMDVVGDDQPFPIPSHFL